MKSKSVDQALLDRLEITVANRDAYIKKLEKALKEPPQVRLPDHPGDETKVKLFEDPKNGIFSGTDARVVAIISARTLSHSPSDLWDNLAYCNTEPALSKPYLAVSVGEKILLVEKYTTAFKALKTVPYPKQEEE